MKQAFKIFGLLFIITPFLGLFLCLQIQKQITKKEVKWNLINNTPYDDLVFLKFSKQEATEKLKWKHSKEFSFNGEMFDIVKKEVKQDSVFYWCWWDHEETTLNKKLNNLYAIALGIQKENKEHKEDVLTFLEKIFNSALITQSYFNSNQKNLPKIVVPLDSICGSQVFQLYL